MLSPDGIGRAASAAVASRRRNEKRARTSSGSIVIAVDLVPGMPAEAGKRRNASMRTDDGSTNGRLRLGIYENRLSDLGCGEARWRRYVDRAALESASTGDQRQRNGSPAIFTPVTRGDMPRYLHGCRLSGIEDDLRPLVQHQA